MAREVSEEDALQIPCHSSRASSILMAKGRRTSLLSSSKFQALPERFIKYRIHEEGRGQRRS
jgi:hypothetical protein